jgi:hypothetical protein
MSLPRLSRLCLLALSLATAFLIACGPPSPSGRWQQEDNPNAGLEIRDNGQFTGELGKTGEPRVRLEGTWKANGADVSLSIGGALGQAAPGLVFPAKIQGDVMTISPPANVPGLTGTVTLRKQAGGR